MNGRSPTDTHSIVSGLELGNLFEDQQRYRTEENDSVITIVRSDRRQYFGTQPVALLTWMPRGGATGFTWNRLVAGLGLDLENVGVLLGSGVTCNSNLTLTAGAVVRREQALHGRYAAGDTVVAALDEAQLHKVVARVRPFLALNVRFTSNPFAKDESTKEPDTTRQEDQDHGDDDGNRGSDR